MRTAKVMFQCGSVADQHTEDLGFKPWPDQHSESLNDREEIAAFEMTSAIDLILTQRAWYGVPSVAVRPFFQRCGRLGVIF